MSPRLSLRRRSAGAILLWALVAVAALGPARLGAQRVPERDRQSRPAPSAAASASFVGTVLDASTGQPIAGARLASPSLTGVTATDSAGRFSIAGVPAGIVRFHLVAAGFPRSSFTLAFAPGERMERTLEMDSSSVAPAEPVAQPVAPVTVEAAPAPRPQWLVDFERRRETGRGQYLTRAQIERGGGARLADAVQMLRGVTLECGGGGGDCRIRMARAPLQCYPDYWVDNQLDNSWGPLIPIRDIEALEIYTGPSDAPGEFAGRTSGCGVIVIWTRRGPGAPGRRP